MWFYDNISRDEFEKRKDTVERIMRELGAVKPNINLPYRQKTTSHTGGLTETHRSRRPVFKFNNEYFRVDEFLCKEKPFIVIEYGTYDELMKNVMHDAEPFPYDLPDDEIKSEIKKTLI
ncbi:MAG: hypothetical protein J1F64_00195 [Oscillospiraceae bacterium]|nr:hypothetical protein [Oscillospiraceae bacterium]